ncbi:alpha/beta fold hydrolase [Solimonas sp. SE-A11]|uniref:alpha/beta fold hydrolase n=1 Tax=Solimonas sp. SE-A11 TaxID=3054954 RepID=UPI00259CB732|nr:alpha/beta hydrolase [Solimonas sp. SE-A11]MDM4772556.1 alpha/beta hydrolase [Solimonas sp. SE-A11]
MTATPRNAQTLQLADGRSLGYASYGDPAGAPLIYCHGGGSSRLEPAYADEHARRNRIHIIAVDRPGYGLSSPVPDLSFQAFGRDVLALADALGIAGFAMLGMSAGAPYALHLAVSAPERIRFVALINPSPDTAQPEWKEVSWPTRLGNSATRVPWLMSRAIATMVENPGKAAASFAKKTGWDAAAIRQFEDMIREGLRQREGRAMLRYEATAVLHRPWGLDWSKIRTPVIAICGFGDGARPLYLALSRRYHVVSVTEIPGPHMPIVTGTAWDRIGNALSAFR